MTSRRRARRRRDAGLSFIEVLAAVALLGIAVIGTMPALWASVHGSALQDRFAGARRWLVSAGDYAVSPALGRRPCTVYSISEIIAHYETDIRAGVALERPPTPWADPQLTVTGVLFSNGTTFGSPCNESTGLTMQQISLRVVSPDGTVVETLDVVKSE